MARVVSFPTGSGDLPSRAISKHHLNHNRIRLLCEWLHSLIHITIPASDLVTCLRDGVLLCKLMNCLHPGSIQSIDYENTKDAWAANLSQFLNTAQDYVQDMPLFDIDDLIYGTNSSSVLRSLLFLQNRHSASMPCSSSERTLSTLAADDTNKLSKRFRRFTTSSVSLTASSCHATHLGHPLLTIGDNGMNSYPVEKGALDACCDEKKGSHHFKEQGSRYEYVNDLSAHFTRDDLPCTPDLLPSSDAYHLPRLNSDSDNLQPPTSDQEEASFQATAMTPSASEGLSPLAEDAHSSGDSGYSTSTRKSTPKNLSTPVHLASLFEPPISPTHPAIERDESLKCRVMIPANEPSINAPETPSASPQGSLSSSSSSAKLGGSVGAAAASRLARLSSLTFGKKLSIRSKMPFHMRYQEWTDHRRQQRCDFHLHVDSVRSCTVDNLDEDPLDCSQQNGLPRSAPVQSASSPLYKTEQEARAAQPHPSHRGGWHTNAHKVSPSTDVLRVPVEDVTEERLLAGVPRRKSTGTLFSKESKPVSDESACLELCDESGARIGLYRLGNSIGKGQFGTVYRALNVKTGQMVAIKQIKLSANDNDLEDVMQEARLLQSLAHPNIVKYEGFIQDAECINIVLEFVENGSLANTLKAFGSFPESLVASYSLRILQGLAYLHDQHVAHCDLKAANILTTKAGDVKLSDFGVSLNLHLKEAATGTVAGTPNWMAPEVIELKGATTKSDIWSLGCTIIELYTGKPPYADLIPMTTLFRIVEDDCPPLPVSLPSDMRDFLKLCFRKNPDDRPTALELLMHPWIMQNAANFSETDQSSVPDMGSIPEEPSSLATQRNSILVHKLQERQGKGEEPIVEREHCFVKGSFAKASIKCKACQIPIKRNAFVCEDCGFICHDKCRHLTACLSDMVNDDGKSSIRWRSMEQLKTTVSSPVSYKHRPSDSSILSSLSRGTAATGGSVESPSLSPSPSPSPRPAASVSTQLRERTRKLSKVFTTGSQRRPHTTRSHDTLRFIHEDEVLQEEKNPSKPDVSESKSAKKKHTRNSSIATPGRETKGRKRKSTRSSSQPDECIIS